MRKAQLLFSVVLLLSQVTLAGPTLDYKLKYGTGIFLFDDKTEYAPQYATHKMDLTKVEINKQLEIFSGKDPNSDRGIGTKYELRVYRPDYPKDKKISRWIEIESGVKGLESFQSAHYNTKGELDSYTNCRLLGSCSVLDANICKTIIAGMDEVLTKSNTTLAEMEACESKGFSIYRKMKALNKSINEDKAYQAKAEGLIKTLNAELPKMNISYDVRDKKVELKKYEDTIPDFFSRQITDYNECKKLMPHFDKAAGGASAVIPALVR